MKIEGRDKCPVLVGDNTRNDSPLFHVVKQVRLDDGRFHYELVFHPTRRNRRRTYPCLVVTDTIRTH